MCKRGLWKSKGAAKQVKSHRHHAVIAARYRPRLLHDWDVKRHKWRDEPKGKRFQCREELLYSPNSGLRRNPPKVL